MLVGRLAAPAPQPGEWTEADWISDLDLETTLLKAYADKYHPHPLIEPIRRKVKILKLLMQVYGNMAIAQALGTTEGAIRDHRNRIRCLQEGITPPEPPTPGGWRPVHAYRQHRRRQTPSPSS